MAIHSKEEALAVINSMPDQCWKDGIYFDNPKGRRRSQAMGLKQIRVNVPKDIQKRFGTQVNRFVELLGKELGWVVICLLLEYPADKRLIALGEQEGYDPNNR